MFRNREIRRLLLIQFAVAALGIAACLFTDLPALIPVLLVSAGLLVSNAMFTRWRYRRLQELSDYFNQICAGRYDLDIRTNEEGELSILKNEIYKVTLRLSEQAQLLQRDKKQLADAISDISHQLKTPLTSMSVMTDLLAEGNLAEDKRKEFLRNIRTQLERIEWLVSSLLKLSKIDAGTAEFKRERISAAEVVKRAVEPMLIPMELRRQQLVVQGEDVFFSGDINWTTEALINLIKNCVEHTKEGGTITVEYSDNPLYAEIRVIDNGCGIAREDLPYIFKRFYRGKNASDESVGIGLAMAKSIVEHQNGDLSVISKEGIGTQFNMKFYNLAFMPPHL